MQMITSFLLIYRSDLKFLTKPDTEGIGKFWPQNMAWRARGLYKK